MSFIIVIWIVWAVLAVVLLGLLLYHMNITQDEENELFLEGSDDFERRRQDEIAAKLKRLKPFLRICGGVEAAATLVLVAFYITDAMRQF